jgi:hypothetical protein
MAKRKRVIHFSDSLGPICGIASDRAIGARSPMFPMGVSCSKCLKKIAVMAGALMKFKSEVEKALSGTETNDHSI